MAKQKPKVNYRVITDIYGDLVLAVGDGPGSIVIRDAQFFEVITLLFDEYINRRTEAMT